MTSRVVITGLGSICGHGIGTQTLWEALCAGRSAIKPFDKGNTDLSIKVAARLDDFSPEQYFPADILPLLDRFSQFALLAAREAVEQAGLPEGDEALNKAAAIIGTGCGGKQTDEDTYAKLYKEHRSRVHPLTIPKGMPSAAASMVSQQLGIKGPVFSVTSACASGAHAVGQGSSMIQSGLVDVAVVGGTDAPFTYGLMKSWEAVRAISSDTCRPFSRDRSGMVLGEGAGMLVLESEKHAIQRGVKILAELAGVGMSSDAGHITRPDIDGISRAVSAALANGHIEKESVDYINAHGTGTLANDLAETQAVHKVFGDHAHSLAISSTKSMHGHALGAASALELVATTMTILHGRIPPTVNFTEPGEGCDLDYVPNQSKEQRVDMALSNSFAFGGLNAVVALKKWDSKI